jgi:hypothetical protein
MVLGTFLARPRVEGLWNAKSVENKERQEEKEALAGRRLHFACPDILPLLAPDFN